VRFASAEPRHLADSDLEVLRARSARLETVRGEDRLKGPDADAGLATRLAEEIQILADLAQARL